MTLRTKLQVSIHAISGVERATSYQYLALRRSDCCDCWVKLKGKKSFFSSPTFAFRSFISRTKTGISVIIFWARSEIMVSMSRSIPHSLRMLLYWGWRANHSFSLTRVISASQSFSFASVPSFPVFFSIISGEAWRIVLVLSFVKIKTLKKFAICSGKKYLI